MVGVLIEEFADALGYVTHVEGIVEIDNNVGSFDFPNAIFLDDFEKQSVWIDGTAFFDHIFAVALNYFYVALTWLEIVYTMDD